MSKVRDFFASLNKSTKITLISCGCFVALTVAILSFFILFPISPNETIQEKYGREAKASKNTESAQTVTTQPSDNESYIGSKGTAVSRTVTTLRVSRKKNFSVTVTTGEGFFSGGRIPTGETPYNDPDPPEYPTDPPIDYPTEPPTDYPPEYPTDPPVPPLVTDQPPTDPPPTDPPPTDPPPTDPPPTDPPPTDLPDDESGNAQNW